VTSSDESRISIPRWIGTSRRLRTLAVAAVVVVAVAAPHAVSNDFELRSLTLVGIYAVAAVSIDWLATWSGQTSLGHAGVFAVGAYSCAIFQLRFHFSPLPSLLPALVLGAVLGAVAAAAAARIRGPYFAIVTIAIGLILQSLILVFPGVTGGEGGLSGTVPVALPGVALNTMRSYYLAATILVVALIITVLVKESRFAYRLDTVREREALSWATGTAPNRVKIVVFIASFALCSVAGGEFAMLGFISPENFSITLSTMFLISAVLGGLGVLLGPVVGTALIYYFQEKVGASPQNALLLYGCFLVLTPLVLRRGLCGLVVSLFDRIVPDRVWKRRLAPADTERGDPSTAGAALAVDATMTFGGVVALDGVRLRVDPGQTVALVGPNGSGKTTLLNVVSGVYRGSSCTVLIDADDVSSRNVAQRFRHGLARTFQTPQLLENQTVYDNVALGSTQARRSQTISDVIAAAASVGVETQLGRRALKLPAGTRKKVELSRGMVRRPRLLLLDEPAAGLSAEEVRQMAEAVLRIKQSGVSILIAEHRLELVAAVADQVVALDAGHVIASGSFVSVTSDPAVRDAYLGKTALPGEPTDAGATSDA
jgi:ABC-type branched-subunit amino acid transport system ATPase component/ABC-type branched-subunit amino acid transport system permease subunit